MHFIRLHNLDKDLQADLERTIFMLQFDYLGQVARMWVDGGGGGGEKEVKKEKQLNSHSRPKNRFTTIPKEILETRLVQNVNSTDLIFLAVVRQHTVLHNNGNFGLRNIKRLHSLKE